MIFAFGDFELDEECWELRRGGRPLEVAPKAFEIALYLVKNRDRVVSKDELLDAVWSGVAVSEGSLSVSIFALRQLLGDDGQRQEYVKTARSRGYRFVADVREIGAGPAGNLRAPDRSRPPSAPPAREFFAERTAELGTLNVGLEQAMAGSARVLLLSGDPGIGKTRLVEEFADRAEQRAARVIWSWCCEEGGAPELLPWTRLLRALFAGEAPVHTAPASIAEILGVPADQDGPTPGLSEFPLFHSERARFRALEAVREALESASTQKPLLLILEDLHAADSSSLNLLAFLARQLRRARVFIVGTYRPDEIGQQSVRERLFQELIENSTQVPLKGISESQVAALAQARLGRALEPELIRAIHSTTDGNPLFADELLRTIDQEEPAGIEALLRAPKVPARITGAIHKRVTGLSPAGQKLLASAAVLGRNFHLRVLQRVSELRDDELLEALDEVFAKRLILEAPALGHYDFAHGLFRNVLYDDLGVKTRAFLHRRAGDALEDLRLSVKSSSAELANHFLKALPAAKAGKALHYSLEAAEHALAAFAYDEAAAHYTNCIEASSLQPDAETRLTELLVRLGYAERAAGYYAKAAATFGRACELARRLDQKLEFCKAALGQVHARPETGQVNLEVISLLEETISVLEGLPSGEPQPRELLSVARSRLALTLAFTPRRDECDRLSRSGLELAHEVGNPETVVYALHARHWALWNPATLRERYALVAEMLELEPVLKDSERVRQVRACQITDLLEMGDGAGLDAALALSKSRAALFQDRVANWDLKLFETMQLLTRGCFDAAEQLAAEALVEGKRLHERNAGTYTSSQFFWLRFEQGRGAELEPQLRERTQKYPGFIPAHCTLLRLFVELEQTDQARREFEEILETPLAEIPKWILLPCLAHLAAACAFLGDRQRAALLHAELLPYGGQQVVQGPAIVYLGPVSFYLGLLARCLGHFDDACARFEQALRECEALAARPSAARARQELAGTLVQRARRGDAMLATAANDAALSAARELGMKMLEQRCLTLQAVLQGVEKAPGFEARKLAQN